MTYESTVSASTFYAIHVYEFVRDTLN